METVYLETSFISYLASRPSRDLIIAGHQQLTHDWWDTKRQAFSCVTSRVVLDEASQGDAVEIEKRLALLSGLTFLAMTPEAEELTVKLQATGALPDKAFRDLAHVAVATAHRVNYLLTWNCKHLANGQIIRIMNRACQASGYELPIICTPEELMGV